MLHFVHDYKTTRFKAYIVSDLGYDQKLDYISCNIIGLGRCIMIYMIMGCAPHVDA